MPHLTNACSKLPLRLQTKQVKRPFYWRFTMAKRDLQSVATRKYLTASEIEKLLAAAKRGRYPDRDRLVILLSYRHGLRVSELISLQWSSVDFEQRRIFIHRVKRGRHGSHTLSHEENSALEALKKSHDGSGYIFTSERGGPMFRQNINRIVSEIAKGADIAINCTPHVLRHSCGYQLADKRVETRRIQQYLGHRSISSTVIYTDLAGRALDDIWCP